MQEHSVVMLMLSVLTPKDRAVALVKPVIMETERIVKVEFLVVLRLPEVRYLRISYILVVLV